MTLSSAILIHVYRFEVPEQVLGEIPLSLESVIEVKPGHSVTSFLACTGRIKEMLIDICSVPLPP